MPYAHLIAILVGCDATVLSFFGARQGLHDAERLLPVMLLVCSSEC